jgi:CheY-like chemotaxis protein
VSGKDKGHILLVEDEPGVMESMTLLLELEGYQISQAFDGYQGLQKLTDSHPDLILTDYMMPCMDGLEMIRRIRSNPQQADTPIIFISAVLSPETEVKELVDMYLHKPVRVDQLVEVIELLLSRRNVSPSQGKCEVEE